MGIITLCFVGGFFSVYPCWSLPHSYEGNHVQSYSGCYVVVVYVFRTTFCSLCIFQSHGHGFITWSWDYFYGLGINVSQKSVIGWPLCQDIWLFGDISYASGQHSHLHFYPLIRSLRNA
jgi:hypothetical protein